jgi:spore germination protein YaaH
MLRHLRALPLALVVVLLLGTPVSATDPTPSAQPAAPSPTPEPTDAPIGVHAEMAAEHADDGATFAPGDKPGPLVIDRFQRDAGGEIAGELATTALPNGLEQEVYGYLPSWMLSDANLDNLDYELVSTIAYFGVPALSNGALNKTGSDWSGWNSALMSRVIADAHAEGVRVALTVTSMGWNSAGATAMRTLLTSSTNRARLVQEITAAVSARNADGVNLDFEPVPSDLKAQFTSLTTALRAALPASKQLTVAVTGGAASWATGYDLAALSGPGAADALMVMGYDFNWSGSARAGGVAPIDSPHVLDIRSAMAAFLAAVPPSELIWGVPYYGRSWTTQTANLYSLTCRTTTVCPNADGAAGAYGRSWASGYVDASAAAAQRGRRWDPTGQVPWYAYWSTTYDAYVQGYYDDAASLDAKYDLVEANGLRGVGIWHLLMDGSRWELWNELRRHFSVLPFNDIEDSPFWQEITWIAEAGITGGCGEGAFCPRANVRRDQMASFLVRAFGLPATTADYFDDDATNIHEDNINRVAAAGITFGCGERRFCPRNAVPRDEMASFLARALGLPAATQDYFDDDDGTMHEGAINRVAAAHIAGGCATRRFCPNSVVTREQMAAFLARALRS